MHQDREEDTAEQRTSKEATNSRQQLVLGEAQLVRDNKRRCRDSPQALSEEKPQRIYGGDSQELFSMEEEHLSQPKRQRKITEYAQMQQQTHSVMPKEKGEERSKAPRLEGEEESVTNGMEKSTGKNLPSQDTAPSM